MNTIEYPQPVAGFYDLEDVAKILTLSDVVAVKRLIARERIPAGRIGQRGPQRVRAADVERYIAAGCPDLIGPNRPSGSFRPADTFYPHSVLDKIIDKAAEAQLVDVNGDALPAPADGSREMTLKLPPSVIAAAAQPAAQIAVARHRDDPDWLDAGTAYFAHIARGFVSAQIRPEGIASLYESPERYAAEIADAFNKIATGGWRASKPMRSDVPGENGWRTVSLLMPWAPLFTKARRIAVAESAF